ncbi:MAG: hypothetical protein IVW55_14725 [Chloroflexi bacterium]|nr:hypothetical protein [Chloroflexota bacterium]
MDSQQPDAPIEGTTQDVEGEEEVEVTREELISAMQEVVRELSEGLKGPDRESYLSADDLAQNDWFFAGVSDEEGQFAVTMWPAEGEEDMLRIDIGAENDVQQLAANDDQIAALTDDFIDAMSEDYEEYEEYDDEDTDEDEGDLEDEDEEDLDEEDELDTQDGKIGKNGNTPPL